MAVIPIDPDLMYSLIPIYTGCNPEVRKVILQNLDDPIMQLNSKESVSKLLNFISECPKGAEAIIIRCAFIMADAPYEAPGFVEIVKELYTSKINDIRIMTPILRFLEPSEVLILLPQILPLSKQLLKDTLSKLFFGASNFSRAGFQVVFLPCTCVQFSNSWRAQHARGTQL